MTVGFRIYNRLFTPIAKETIGDKSEYMYILFNTFAQLGVKLFYARQSGMTCTLSHFHYGEPIFIPFCLTSFYQPNTEASNGVEAMFMNRIAKLPFIQSSDWKVNDSIDKDGVFVIKGTVRIL